MSNPIRQNVLSAYRNLLKTVRQVPAKKRYEILAQIRTEFRSNSSETSAEKIGEMLKKAQSSLGYIKVISPRTRSGQSGTTKIVFGNNSSNGNGDGSDGGSSSDLNKPLKNKPISNWTGSNIDPDSLARHNANLRRAGFRDNAHAKGIF